MRILLIEDDSFFQHFYFKKLKEKGYQVFVATNGQEGIEKAAIVKPDLILLDIIMPEKNGFEVLQSLSENTMLKTIPVLVFSTLGQEQDVTKAKQLGARDYVNKSFFDFDILLSKITALTKQAK